MKDRGFLTALEVARMIGVSKSRIYEYLDDGKLRGVDIGDGPRARRYIEHKSVLDFLGPQGAKALGVR